MVNPANNLNSPFNWDVNLVAGGFFFENNYGYIRNTHLFEVLKKSDQIVLISDVENENTIDDNALILDYYNDNKKNGYLNTFISGPSFMVNLNGNHSFGLFTNFRTIISGQNLPNELSYSKFNETPYGESIIIPPFNAAGMTWSELGLNYAFSTSIDAGMLGIGISVKKLFGHEAFYFENKGNADLIQLTEDSISIQTLDAELGFSSSNRDNNFNGLENNGSGWAIDLGATLLIGGTTNDYQWKFGLSLLDIGQIKFDRNSAVHQVAIDVPTGLDGRDYENFDDIDSYIQLFSSQLLNDPAASLTADQFNQWLPGAISLQADYSLNSNFFVGALVNQRLSFKGMPNGVRRSNLIVINPRYESRWFGLSFPFIGHNWQDFRIGSSVRLGFLTIGSDNLGSFFRNKEFSGTDFYFALKINPFKISEKGPNNSRKSKGKDVKCYKF